MLKFAKSVGLCLLFQFSAIGHADTVEESQLHFRYSVNCLAESQNAFPGMVGEADFRGRTIRFYLFQYLNEARLSLGTTDTVNLSEVTLRFLPSAACTLVNLEPSVETITLDSNRIEDLARKHSPYLVVRQDQVNLPERDVQLGIAYSVLPNEQGFSIRYTYFFSNETVSGLFSTSKATSLGSWGRRSDVEWIYQVDFARDGTVLDRTYQCGVILGIGHETRHFHGDYLTGTSHPVLYNIAKHNVFGTKPSPGTSPKIGVHLIPESEIKFPLAREHWLWDRPWTFAVTDRELSRDGNLSHPSDEYVYADLSGSLDGGKIQASLTPTDGKIILAGEGSATMTSLGDDLFGQEDYTAIHMTTEDFLSGGTFHIKRSTVKTSLNPPRFYRLAKNSDSGFSVQDISAEFSCSSPYDCSY